MIEKLGSIYLARCIINWKGYCGQTSLEDPEIRIDQHETANLDTFFHRSIRKYGFDNFIFCWLHYKNIPKSKLNQYERYYIWLFDLQNPQKGYNMTPGGDTGFSFWEDEERKEEVIHKMKEAKKTDEYKNKVSGDSHWTKRYPERDKPGNRMKDPETQKIREQNRIKRRDERVIRPPIENETMKEWRKSCVIIRSEISENLSVADSTIDEWENKNIPMSLKHRKRWIDFYGFDPAKFCGLDIKIHDSLMRNWRESQGFSRKELTNLIGASGTVIVRWESGERPITAKFRQKWIDVFNIDPIKEFNIRQSKH